MQLGLEVGGFFLSRCVKCFGLES